CTIVYIPAFVDGNFSFVIPGRQAGGAEAVAAIAIRVLQPGAQAGRIPISATTQLGLVTTRYGSDYGVDVVGDPMCVMGIIKLDWTGVGDIQGNIGAAWRCVQAIIFIPGIIQRGFIFVSAGGYIPAGLPDLIP